MTIHVVKSPQAIIQDILSGLMDPGRALAIEGRAEAVTNVVMQASPADMILVAGKRARRLSNRWHSPS